MRLEFYPDSSDRISFHTDGHGYSRKFILSRIVEFFFTRSSTENHGFIYLVMNSQIR